METYDPVFFGQRQGRGDGNGACNLVKSKAFKHQLLRLSIIVIFRSLLFRSKVMYLVIVFCTLQYVAMERRFLKWTLRGNWFERKTGIHPSDRNLLYRGIWLRMARSGIASFLIVGSYFFIVDNLASHLT